MNRAQKSVVVVGLCIASALLLFIFWRVGNGYQYPHSLLVWPPSEDSSTYGLRLREGTSGVILGLILPVLLVSSAAFIRMSDEQ